MNGTIDIYRADGSRLASVAFDVDSYRRWQVMGEHAVTLNFSLPQTANGINTAFVEIPVGSYIMFKGRRYTLYNPSDFTKNGNRNYAYTLKLYAYQELLNDRIFINEPDGRQVFSRQARPEEFLSAIVRNMNYFDTGSWGGNEWTAGESITSNVQQSVQFNGVSCYEALRLVAEAFKTEWEVNNKVISLRKSEYNKNAPLSLSYGQGNGFKAGLGRGNYGQGRPVHKLYVTGGERNIDFTTYGSQTLLLPKNTNIRFDGAYFEDEAGYSSTLAREYQTSADGKSLTRVGAGQVSRREAFIELKEAYPKRTGAITRIVWIYGDSEYTTYDAAVSAATADGKDAGSVRCDVFDTAIPNDLDYAGMRIAGEQMIFVPQTGRLAGIELGVQQGDGDASDGYIHSERRFKLITDSGYGSFIPDGRLAVGDTYALFGMKMPQTYIANGERDLLKEAVRYKYENEELRFTFKGQMDGIWAQKNWDAIEDKIVAGGYVRFSDPQFHPDGSLIRISAIKEYLHEPYKPELELTNIVTGGGLRGELAEIPQQEVVIDGQQREIRRLEQRRWQDVQELRGQLENVFTEFGESINPVSVASMQYIAGNKMGQFRFVTSRTGNTAAAGAPRIDYDAGNNTVRISGSVTGGTAYIQHQTLDITGIDGKSPSGDNGTNVRPATEYKSWSLPSLLSGVLEKDKFYWVYARVSKTGATGVFLVETTARTVFDDGSYYYLVVGGLNSEKEGERGWSPLFGFTEILPGQITTGMIRSSSGNSFMDLQNNRFHFGDGSNYIDWNNYNSNALMLRGAFAQSQSGHNDLIGTYIGDYSPYTQYYPGDEVQYNGVRYRCTSYSYGVLPTNTGYWQQRDADPLVLYKGNYSSGVSYNGTSQERNVVKYNGYFYISNIVGSSFSGQTPYSGSAYWTFYGANFESVATGLLLAQTAYIENLIVDRICSGLGEGLPRLKATGSDITFYKNKAEETSSSSPLLKIGIDVGYMETIDADAPGISAGVSGSYSELTSEGIFTNGSNMRPVSVVSGNSAVSIGALLNKRVAGYTPALKSINAAIYGRDDTPDTQDTSVSYSEGYGGWFNTLKAGGLHLGARATAKTLWMDKTDCFINCDNGAAITIYLPPDPYAGRVAIVRRSNNTVTVQGNGKQIHRSGTTPVPSLNVGSGSGTIGLFIYDGVWWVYGQFAS
jgi:hypothetical protein